MLGNWKRKLNIAIQEGLVISESLQQRVRIATTPNDSSAAYNNNNTLGVTELGIPADVNLAAGCNLLAKYEDDWRNIHDANEENAAKASQIAQQIESIEQRVTRQRTTLTELNACLAGIPAIVEQLKNSMEVLNTVTELNANTEAELQQLQQLCEECELQEFMLQKQCELSQFKQQKMSNLEVYRQKVAAEHQAKIREHEVRLREIQRERQAVFDDAFRGDVEEFKQKGMLPKIQSEAAAKKLALEEVVLEHNETKDALEEFLNG